LGAGASKPYGLPLGAELTDEVTRFLTSNARVEYDSFLEKEFDLDGFKSLSTLIRRSRTPTLDQYVSKIEDKNYRDVIKGAIAQVIVQHENRVLNDENYVKGDWVSWLYHTLLVAEPDRFNDNKICFLSFNYERLPHLLMARCMANTFDIDIKQAVQKVYGGHVVSSDTEERSIPRFIYLHGDVGTDILYKGENTTSEIDRRMLSTHPRSRRVNRDCHSGLSKNILTIDEGEDATKKAIEMKRDVEFVVQNAKRIFFLGMGYHRPNLDRAGFSKKSLSELNAKDVEFGGTGFKIETNSQLRNSMQGYLGEKFFMGDPDMDCLSFLQNYMT
tara:strand:+ start:236 stop:1225 length:990 start_codon:yes stop_codon:yes gene_type:complete